MTYREIMQSTARRLQEAGIEEYNSDTRILMTEVTGQNMASVLYHADDELDEEILKKLTECTDRRCRREPLQYILGNQEFMGLKFLCNSSCLIPRPDTEMLVETVIKAMSEMKVSAGGKVLDMCTGSGCVGISLAAFVKGIDLTLSDISEEALEVTRKNLELNSVDARVVKSDIFSSIEGVYDVITANPPYIKTSMIQTLMPEVAVFEPKLALDGGEDGVVLYRRILKQAPEHLRKDGLLAFEIGDEEGEIISSLMKEAGFYDVTVLKDYCGFNRVVYGYRV